MVVSVARHLHTCADRRGPTSCQSVSQCQSVSSPSRGPPGYKESGNSGATVPSSYRVKLKGYQRLKIYLPRAVHTFVCARSVIRRHSAPHVLDVWFGTKHRPTSTTLCRIGYAWGFRMGNIIACERSAIQNRITYPYGTAPRPAVITATLLFLRRFLQQGPAVSLIPLPRLHFAACTRAATQALSSLNCETCGTPTHLGIHPSTSMTDWNIQFVSLGDSYTVQSVILEEMCDNSVGVVSGPCHEPQSSE
ncbi:hypothetical protein EV127DRAFT_74724 [Xylaria flabelliformis]|nr:hypothetical protein EV127DRAFT_74724 [Xylaria flabelliformis]